VPSHQLRRQNVQVRVVDYSGRREAGPAGKRDVNQLLPDDERGESGITRITETGNPATRRFTEESWPTGYSDTSIRSIERLGTSSALMINIEQRENGARTPREPGETVTAACACQHRYQRTSPAV
jgi:hypothetical protein